MPRPWDCVHKDGGVLYFSRVSLSFVSSRHTERSPNEEQQLNMYTPTASCGMCLQCWSGACSGHQFVQVSSRPPVDERRSCTYFVVIRTGDIKETCIYIIYVQTVRRVLQQCTKILVFCIYLFIVRITDLFNTLPSEYRCRSSIRALVQPGQ